MGTKKHQLIKLRTVAVTSSTVTLLPVLHYGPKRASLLFVGMHLPLLCDSTESQLTSSPFHTHLFMLVLVFAMILVATCCRKSMFPHTDLLVRRLSLAGVAVPVGTAQTAILVSVAGRAVTAVVMVVHVQVRGIMDMVVFMNAIVLVLITRVMLRGIIPRSISRRLADLLLLLLLFPLFPFWLVLSRVCLRGRFMALLCMVTVTDGIVARVPGAVVLVPVRARVVVVVTAALVMNVFAILLH